MKNGLFAEFGISAQVLTATDRSVCFFFFSLAQVNRKGYPSLYHRKNRLGKQHQNHLLRIHISMHQLEENGDPSNAYVHKMQFQML